MIDLFGADIPEELVDVNLPGVLLLATSGVGAMFFIVRWMIKYQREFTNFYIEENNRLRARIEAVEDDCTKKDREYEKLSREFLLYERTAERRISALESKIAQNDQTIHSQDAKIARHEKTIGELSRRERDKNPE